MDRFRTRTKSASVGLLVLCEALSLALWFAATAIIPVLKRDFPIDDARASLFTSVVAFGYVAGTVGSALLNLADRLPPRLFFAASAWVAAAANIAILWFEPTSTAVVALRFLTGVCIAGLYPVGMKMAATWARGDAGFLISVLVAGLTLGAAVPHLINAIGALDWRFTLIVASSLCAVAGLLVNLVGLGPAQAKAPPFDPAAALKAFTNRSIRLANLGYIGHLWELYAMWAWVALYLHASFAAASPGDVARVEFHANLATFAVIGAGAIGCLVLGRLADRMGRTAVTVATMAASAACALAAGLLFESNAWLVLALCLVWGFVVVPDAPQTSACVVELADPANAGTMLTVQTCAGFIVAPLAVHLVPQVVAAFGWRYGFVPLALGPVVGGFAMWRLRKQPDAIRLAGGRR